VNFIFRSFGLREDFFKGHQEAYLSDLVRILQYTGIHRQLFELGPKRAQWLPVRSDSNLSPEKLSQPACPMGGLSLAVRGQGGTMVKMLSRHHNNCPRCPVIGAEDIPGDEYFNILAFRFNIQLARRLCRPSMLHRVEQTALREWLEHVRIFPAHLDHLPLMVEPGIMVTIPSDLGRPNIDGNHCAARALRDGTEYLAYLLPEAQTLELLRGSMGRSVADDLWSRLHKINSQPNHDRKGQ
jgi:hypothetical protein